MRRFIHSALWVVVALAMYVTVLAYMQNRDLEDRLFHCPQKVTK